MRMRTEVAKLCNMQGFNIQATAVDRPDCSELNLVAKKKRTILKDSPVSNSCYQKINDGRLDINGTAVF